MLSKLYNAVKKFHSEEDAPTMVEYGLMVALIAVVCIAGATLLGVSINGIFSGVAATVGAVPTN